MRQRTRRSLHYLAGYLMTGGVALVVHPGLALRLLMASGDYGVEMPRLAGSLMIALGLLVVQMIRLRLEQLYPATLGARAVILVVLAWLYAGSGDRLFVVLLGVVGLGFVLTGSSYLLDRQADAGAGRGAGVERGES